MSSGLHKGSSFRVRCSGAIPEAWRWHPGMSLFATSGSLILRCSLWMCRGPSSGSIRPGSCIFPFSLVGKYIEDRGGDILSDTSSKNLDAGMSRKNRPGCCTSDGMQVHQFLEDMGIDWYLPGTVFPDITATRSASVFLSRRMSAVMYHFVTASKRSRGGPDDR